MIRNLFIAALLLLSGAAFADARADAIGAAAMDCISSGEAMAGMARELNPLGAVAACALKVPAVAIADKLPEPSRTQALHAERAVWDGVAAHNVAVIVGMHAAAASGVGIVVAAVIWQHGAEEREFMRLCAIHEQLAGHPLTCIYSKPSGTRGSAHD